MAVIKSILLFYKSNWSEMILSSALKKKEAKMRGLFIKQLQFLRISSLIAEILKALYQKRVLPFKVLNS